MFCNSSFFLKRKDVKTHCNLVLNMAYKCEVKKKNFKCTVVCSSDKLYRLLKATRCSFKSHSVKRELIFESHLQIVKYQRFGLTPDLVFDDLCIRLIEPTTRPNVSLDQLQPPAILKIIH